MDTTAIKANNDINTNSFLHKEKIGTLLSNKAKNARRNEKTYSGRTTIVPGKKYTKKINIIGRKNIDLNAPSFYIFINTRQGLYKIIKGQYRYRNNKNRI